MNIKAHLFVEEAMKRWYEVEMISEEYNMFYLPIKGQKTFFKAVDCGLWSSLSHKLCKSKEVTNFMLDYCWISAPQYSSFKKSDMIDVDKIAFPVVVKPSDRSCNKGVTMWINDKETLTKAIDLAYTYSDKIIIQKHVEWDLFRIFVLDGKIIAITMISPPFVVWDGASTIKELIDKENNGIHRNWGKFGPAFPIVIEHELIAHLDSFKYSLDSILPKDSVVVLRKNPQLSLGGITRNLPLSLHPSLENDCKKIASLLWLPWAGIDILSKDINWGEYAIIEVNSQPNFRMHQYPVFGDPINVSSFLLDYIINAWPQKWIS
jgi:cyanophycin synthetase